METHGPCRIRVTGVGLVAAWVNALSELPLQAAAEPALPPSPAQKQELGAEPSGRPENMPPAVVVGRAAAALGHPGLSAGQRVRAPQVIHLWESTSHAVFGTALEAMRRVLRG